MRYIYLFLFLLFSTSSMARQIAHAWELENNMPRYYEAMKEGLTYPDAWGNSEIDDFESWRSYARELLLDALQYTPDTTQFAPHIVAQEEREGYTLYRISFNINSHSRVPAYLLVPQGEGPFPAVTVLHDHGAKFDIGKEKNVRPFASDTIAMQQAQKWVDKYYEGIFTADYLAANGYVVLVVDALFWGERGCKEGSQYDTQQAFAANLMQLGKSWCGMILADDVRSVAFLASLPCVDSARIGAVGFSMGAHRAWLLSAATDMVCAAAAVCWISTTDALMIPGNNQLKGGSAYAMIVPGLRAHLDYPHVAAIACPKPMLFINGSNDALLAVDGVEEAYAHMHNVWDECEVDDRLVTTTYDAPHTFNAAMHKQVLQFLDRWIKQ